MSQYTLMETLKAYQCYICNQTFYIFDNFKSHTRRHSSSWPYLTEKRIAKDVNYQCIAPADPENSSTCKIKKKKVSKTKGARNVVFEEDGSNAQRKHIPFHLESTCAQVETIRTVLKESSRKESKPERNATKVVDTSIVTNLVDSQNASTNKTSARLRKKALCAKELQVVITTLDVDGLDKLGVKLEKQTQQLLLMNSKKRTSSRSNAAGDQIDGKLGVSTSADEQVKSVDQTTCKQSKKRRRHGDNTWRCKARCNVCLKVFARLEVLEIHMRRHTGETPFKCKICSKSFRQRGQLTYHMMDHTGETRQFKCQFCAKEFKRHYTWLNHEIATHQYTELLENKSLMKSRYGRIVKIYECQYCGKLFTILQSWEMHERSHRSERNHVCKTCGKAFNHKSNLTEHERIHLNLKPYPCEYCGKSFRFQSNLTSHVNMHLGVRNYDCSYCDKKFLQQVHLNKHIYTHTGEKPYQCPHCDHTAAQQSSMDTHIRAHHTSKSYQCPLCDYTCTAMQKDTLYCHIREKHAEERPHHCSQCGYSAAQSIYVRDHIRAVHRGEKSHRCPYCDYKAARKDRVKAHIRIMHTK